MYWCRHRELCRGLEDKISYARLATEQQPSSVHVRLRCTVSIVTNKYQESPRKTENNVAWAEMRIIMRPVILIFELGT